MHISKIKFQLFQKQGYYIYVICIQIVASSIIQVSCNKKLLLLLQKKLGSRFFQKIAMVCFIFIEFPQFLNGRCHCEQYSYGQQFLKQKLTTKFFSLDVLKIELTVDEDECCVGFFKIQFCNVYSKKNILFAADRTSCYLVTLNLSRPVFRHHIKMSGEKIFVFNFRFKNCHLYEYCP